MTRQRRYQRRAAPRSARELIAGAVGYVLAWAIVLGLALAACGVLGAHYGPITPGQDVAPTLAPFPTFEPVTEAPSAVPAPTDDPNATPAPTVLYDCGDADPEDPEIDPEYDCEQL